MGWFEKIFEVLSKYWYTWSPPLIFLCGVFMFLSRQRTKRQIKTTATKVADVVVDLSEINAKIDTFKADMKDTVLSLKNELEIQMLPIKAYIQSVIELAGNEEVRAKCACKLSEFENEAKSRLEALKEGVVETIEKAAPIIEQAKKVKLKIKQAVRNDKENIA